MWWPFKKKPEHPKQPRDCRDWSEDWKVGDIAECVARPEDWDDRVPPWSRLARGSQWRVLGFSEGLSLDAETLEYWLKLEGAPYQEYSTRAFRKVRPIAKEESEIVKRILNAPAGPDKVRDPNLHPHPN